ncbi:MAG TPA: DUF1963 domain-containing protein [Methylocystis sp.]|nr:DUF1963 domain-containing protein [Methylocystis sp.]
MSSSESFRLVRFWPPASAPQNWVTRIGGFPNLPPEYEWPVVTLSDGSQASLDFLAQIRLADLPQAPERSLLPKEGVLYFFALALAGEPLEEEHGRDSWRVLYYPGDASAFPSRTPPANSARVWEESDNVFCEASELCDPEARHLTLFPACPAYFSLGEQLTDWRHDRYEYPAQPYRVEDALLTLNRARCSWGEGFMPFDELVEREHRYNIDDGAEAWAVALSKARDAHASWLPLVKEAVEALKGLGRPHVLGDAERARVLALVEESGRMKGLLGETYWCLEQQTAFPGLALPILLQDFPEIAAQCPQEVEACDPRNVASGESSAHFVLGRGCAVQRSIGDDEVLLLQLGSDSYGPRFMWWDCGAMTFTIKRDDLAELRFDLAQAKIEGH